MLPSTSLTPPSEDQLVPLYPSYCWIVVLKRIEPAPGGATVFSLSLPAGILRWVTEFIITCLPAFGSISKSWTVVEILLSCSLSSWPIIKGQSLLGPILTSSTSLNINSETATCEKVSCAVPLLATPDVWVGSVPWPPVVPADVTSYKLFLYLI